VCGSETRHARNNIYIHLRNFHIVVCDQYAARNAWQVFMQEVFMDHCQQGADIMENTCGVKWSIQVHVFEMLKGMICWGLLPVSCFQDCIELNGDHAVPIQVEPVQVDV
jgi:hypothetical protein